MTSRLPEYMVVGRPCKLGHIVRYVATGKCVECRRASGEAYRKADPEKRRAYFAAWHLANPGRRSASYAKWRQANPEKVRAYTAAWQKANRAACNANDARRNARKVAAPGRGVSAAEWENCLTESLGICAYCNERRPLTMDHIEPLARGGAHDIDNIAAVCGSCNPSKGDKPLLVWLASRRLGEPPLRQTHSIPANKATLGLQRGVSVPPEAMAAA